MLPHKLITEIAWIGFILLGFASNFVIAEQILSESIDKFSCNHCYDGDCDEPITEVCGDGSVEDQCYMHFDSATHSVSSMGCKSDLTDDELKADVKGYFLCNGSNCNKYENLPPARVCLRCSSKSNVNCAIAPQILNSNARCQHFPFTECYTRIHKDGNTERGCLYDLQPTDFLDCRAGENCEICSESRCNGLLYPADRLQCYNCNSQKSSECESAPTKVLACPLHTADEACVSKLQNGITYRGCSSELSCEGVEEKFCRSCNTTGCNNEVIADSSIGVPGLFQDLPLNCYHCTGVEECSAKGKINACAGDEKQTCSTVFGSDGKVVARGCRDSVQQQCSGPTAQCYHCNSNGCNEAKHRDDYIDCLFCDSQLDAECNLNITSIAQTRKCHKSCMTKLYQPKFNPQKHVIRSCLDDLDLDDRELCVAGDQGKCKACSTTNCNVDVLAEKTVHRSCLKCVGGSCENPVATACGSGQDIDHCYLLFNNVSDVVDMGCFSDLNKAFVEENQHMFVLCNETDNCNTFEKIPETYTCVACNSTGDPACASDPASVASMEECAVRPSTECTTYVNKDGVTVRGCLSHLEPRSLWDCKTGQSKQCTTCIGNRCNIDIYPEGRRSCHRCNSQEDTACEFSPNAASICPLYAQEQFCSTKIVNGQTYRGCSTEFQCDESAKQYCSHCKDGDNCNDVDLSGVGFPGMWQDVPINCYNCVEEGCAKGSGNIQLCANNEWQTCLTVFKADGAAKARGCNDEVMEMHGDYCEEHPNSCLPCKSNGCNNAASLNNYTDCYFCDSAKSTICQSVTSSTPTRKCHDGCMVALYERRNPLGTVFEVSRSCLDDKDLDDREACRAGTDDLCQHCNGSLCNTADLLNARKHECYHCVAGDCENTATQKCQLYQPHDQCFILFDQSNSIINMGCRSDHTESKVIDLIKSKKMLLCDGKNCNSPGSIRTENECSVCHSKTDPRCATNPNLISDKEKCMSVPYTDCYTRVGEDGHTSRGCLAMLEPGTFYNCLMTNDSMCETCWGTRCNAPDIYPGQRLRCYHCDSVTDPNCYYLQFPANSQACPIYKQDDACITIRNESNVVTRGCASSLQCDDPDDPRTCQMCSTTNCNTHILEISNPITPGRWQELPLSCLTCEGADNCRDGALFRVCEGIPNENCATVFSDNGTVVQRGCSGKVFENNAYCGKNIDKCPLCSSNGCNYATSLTDYVKCRSCDSKTDGKCVLAPMETVTTRMCHKHCMTALYKREKEEENPAYELTRTCLDDMDLDDRLACQAGSNELCEACSGAECNNASIPSHRLSCYHCSGDDCKNPRTQTCTSYRIKDHCYIQYNEKQSIVGMGCRSEFSNEKANELMSSKHLFLCEDDNCNKKSAVIRAQSCLLCNSRTDPECATDPKNVTSKTICRKVPNTGCYSRVLLRGETERGCISDLNNEEFSSCVKGESTTCLHCRGKKCNNKIFPTNRTMCHICDSETDPNCHLTPNHLAVCPIYVQADTCVTSFQNGVTRRGCRTQIFCDVNYNRTCVACSGSGCNTVQLKNAQDDNYGKWQDLPLRCLTCTGAECAIMAQPETCKNNNQQDCVTIFDASGEKVVHRGCSDALEADCQKNQDNCYRCKSNECNNAKNKTEFVDCVYCDSGKDPTCIWNPYSSSHATRRCQQSCMSALYAADSSNATGYHLIRTCLNDKEREAQGHCLIQADGKCSACNSHKCNVDDVPENRLYCLKCSGDDCETPTSFECPIYKKDDKCYTTFDETNSVVDMGCVSSVRNQDLEALLKTKRVLLCDGDDCNADLPPPEQKCISCSSADDKFCAASPWASMNFETCSQMPHTGCYTKVMNSGVTQRGCLAELPPDDFLACLQATDSNCSICQGDGCNREMFPSDRLQCYTCSSDNDPSCESFPNVLSACNVISSIETCASALSGTRTVRGCSSSIYCNATDKSTCRYCTGTACNSIDLRNKKDDGYHGAWQALPLRCHTCQGDDCKYSVGVVKYCRDNDAQDCMTVFSGNGSVQRRGCSDEVEDYEDKYCRLNPANCFKCKSNECNDAWNREKYVQCAFCNSTADPKCALSPEETEFDIRDCYMQCMVAMKGDAVIRSCLDDKEVSMQHDCYPSQSASQCISCRSSHCNKMMFPPDRARCHVCTDKECTKTQSHVCSKYDDECFALYDSDGQVKIMGCAASQDASDIDNWSQAKRLYLCEGNDCNDLPLLPKANECIKCNSASDADCAQNPHLLKTTKECRPPLSDCLTWITAGGDTVRGCESDLSFDVGRNCLTNNTCDMCNTSKCNTEIFPDKRRTCFVCNSHTTANCSKTPQQQSVCRNFDPNAKCVSSRDKDGFVERGCDSDITCAPSSKICKLCTHNNCNGDDLSSAAVGVVASLAVTLLSALLAIYANNR